MRTRHEIEEDEKDSNIPYGKLMLEILLDIREQNELIISYLKLQN